ncbi:MAG: hypothetical protein FJ291_13530 [Planctomycetes bacterium]|nr:hypothetical protein [Planctomycetota bacterium]
MSADALVAQVKGLEVQLTVLKARLREANQAAARCAFADLEGILAGVAESTEDELAAAEYRVGWDEEGTGE